MNKSYVAFVEIEKKPKTSIYAVNSKSSGERLGIIKWHSTWRQYCFFPEGGTLWSHGCLGEIMGFIIGLMGVRRTEP